MEFNWSTDVYRLDHIANKFPLPCVVQVTEGIYRETEAESFSAGDIIKLDKFTRIPKVAANFTENPDGTEEARAGIANILKSEIYVPLNYKGTVNIVTHINEYTSVKDLAKDFPRYAVVKQDMTVETEQHECIKIKSGTRIELDRIMPGQKVGNRVEHDKLVFKFENKGVKKYVGVATSKRGRFQTCPDDGEYTIKEVIERFPLPQTVHFLKNDLKKAYMETLVDMAENMHSYTDTLTLKRLVSQEVLIGHYKPLGDSESLAHRTVVILPIDASYVREIEVNVLEDASEEDYEKLSLIPVPPRTVDSVAEMIYVDFDNSPGFIKMDDQSYDNSTTEKVLSKSKSTPDYDVPPPRPPKPKKLEDKGRRDDFNVIAPPYPDDGVYEELAPGPLVDRSTKKSSPPHSPDDDYLEPIFSGDSLADINFAMKGKLPKKAHRSKTFLDKVKSKLYISSKDIKRPLPSVDQPDTPTPDDDDDEYDFIDEKIMSQKPKHGTLGRIFPKRSPKSPTSSKKPTAIVAPHNSGAAGESSEGEEDSFESLTIEQTYVRLQQCGMSGLAEICKQENLDGNFIVKMDVDMLKKDPFNLSTFDITKLERIKENWVPK